MHGLIALHRGLDNQNSFLNALENLPDILRPYWLSSVREATRAEDKNGFDAFARLDVGECPIQIKSSTVGADSHLDGYPNYDGVIIIMHDGVSEMDIREATIVALRRWRILRLLSMRHWHRKWMPILNFTQHRSYG